MRLTMVILSAIVISVPLSGQTLNTVAARFSLLGKPAIVSVDDLAFEMLRRFQHTDRGREALRNLIDLELVHRAAADKGLTPSAAEARRWIAKLERQLESHGRNLSTLLSQKSMTRKQFEEYASLIVAQERLVRETAELKEDEEVTSAMRSLWVKEARTRNKVITETKQLAPGQVARVGARMLTDLDLGRFIVRSSDVEERRKYLRQIIVKRSLAARAKAHNIEVTDDDMQHEVAARQRAVENDPRMRGVPFAQVLESQGSSIEELRRSPVVRAQLQERKLVRELHPDEQLSQRLETDREAVLRHHGPRRKLQILFVAAPLTPEGTRDLDTAEQKCKRTRALILDSISFSNAARRYSDDPYTKVSGGDSGWHHEKSLSPNTAIPAQIISAGFLLPLHEISPPIRSELGFYLLRVTEIEPAPPDIVLTDRMREALRQKLRQKILADAAIQFEY